MDRLVEIEERFGRGADTMQDMDWLIQQVHLLRAAVDEYERDLIALREVLADEKRIYN